MDDRKFDAVALSGGGSRGILMLGVLHYYYEKGLFDPKTVTEYAGASIGSVMGLLLICGYTPMEIFSEIYSMESFFTVNDCHSIWDVIKYMGFMSIKGFAAKIEELVKRKMGFVPTLRKLKELTGKSLYVSGANVTSMAEEKYCAETHPSLSCVNAVKISCNLPLIFQRLRYREAFVVDGGLLNNYPWDYISPSAKNVLGVVLVGSDRSLPEDTFMGYFYRLMMMPIAQLTEMRCQLAPDHITTIKVAWEGVPLLQFAIASEQKMDMFLSGYQTAETRDQTKLLYVADWDFEKAGWSSEDSADSSTRELTAIETLEELQHDLETKSLELLREKLAGAIPPAPPTTPETTSTATNFDGWDWDEEFEDLEEFGNTEETGKEKPD